MIKLNGREVKPTIFPDKTSQVWHIDIQPFNYVVWYFEDEGELIHLAQLALLLRGNHNILKMPYLPYARQDKLTYNNKTFALRAFADIINSMEWDNVVLFDAHSRVATEVIENSHDMIPYFGFAKHYDVIVFPDVGAYHRYKYSFGGRNIIIGNKVRNESDGRIVSYSVHLSDREGKVGRSIQTQDVEDKTILVVDDICDGGATFLLLGSKLKNFKLKTLDLYVTHGIFSKGLASLYEIYDKIYTTESLYGHLNLDDMKADACQQSLWWYTFFRCLEEKTLVILPGI